MSADILSFVQSCIEPKLSVFPRLAPVASFPSLCTGYKALFTTSCDWFIALSERAADWLDVTRFEIISRNTRPSFP